jgi:hypothetical protein
MSLIAAPPPALTVAAQPPSVPAGHSGWTGPSVAAGRSWQVVPAAPARAGGGVRAGAFLQAMARNGAVGRCGGGHDRPFPASDQRQ